VGGKKPVEKIQKGESTMVRALSQWMDYVLAARDGEMGKCKDFLVDDLLWIVRYLVVDTGKWLPGRKVLVSPHQLGDADSETRRLLVRLTREEIESSPALEEAKSVSREYEIEWHRHYGLSGYWLEGEKKVTTVQLLSVGQVSGYHIQARDGEIGHVADFLAVTDTWKVHYAIIDTRNWLQGRQVCVLTDCIQRVDTAQEKMRIDLTKEAIRNSPPYQPYLPMTQEYQVVLHDYYGWPKYWDEP
jgi:hypothetical protein